MKHRNAEQIEQTTVVEAIARTPLDQYVIWDGSPGSGQKGSLCSRALSCIDEVWEPVPLRALLQRAANLSAGLGLHPDRVRNAVRMHQTATSVAYLLVRRTAGGDYVAVCDVPWPSARRQSLRAGDLVLDRSGRRFPDAAQPPSRPGLFAAQA